MKSNIIYKVSMNCALTTDSIEEYFFKHIPTLKQLEAIAIKEGILEYDEDGFPYTLTKTEAGKMFYIDKVKLYG